MSAVRTASETLPLLDYRDFYELWERQQWRVQDLDFTQDRTDWHERFARDRRTAERFGFSGFFLGEQRVTRELGPVLRAAPSEETRLFLSTQIADEARHVAFFDRFFDEVGVMRADHLEQRIQRLDEHRGEGFECWFDDALARRTDRLAARPDDIEAFVEAVTIYHLLIEGTIAGPRSTSSSAGWSPRARSRGSSRASRTSPATSTGTSPSASASCTTRLPPAAPTPCAGPWPSWSPRSTS